MLFAEYPNFVLFVKKKIKKYFKKTANKLAKIFIIMVYFCINMQNACGRFKEGYYEYSKR
jgi:hypothetical protein